MKHYLLILFLFITATVAYGQQDICSHLEASGRVLIQQDNRLTDLLGTSPKTYYAHTQTTQNSDNKSLQTMGFRIRVFSGNQQTVSKNRCYAIQANINNQMPELPTYVTFKTPNWRISVGDFRTSEEAHSALHQLKQEFPNYAQEMFVVKETINL